MGLCFFETMRGDLTDRHGGQHLVEFEIKVEAPSALGFLRRGRGRVTGVLHAPPWAQEAPVEGTLTVSLPKRSLVYDLQFRADDGRLLTLAGRKDLRARSPLKTSTRLRAVLRGPDGRRLAWGPMRFDLGEAGAFAASWWPSSLPADDAEPEALDPALRALLDALVPALLVPGARVPPPDATTADRALELLGRAPGPMRAAWKLALGAVDAVALARHRRRFADLDLALRQALLQDLSRPGASVGPVRTATLVTLAGLPVRAAHFDGDRVSAAIGYPVAPPLREEAPPRWHRQVTPAEALPADSEVEAEVVVVGTGAGGAALAAGLAARGVAVALVEEGRLVPRHAYAGSVADRMHMLFRDGGLRSTLGTPPIATPLGRVVGGTTVINSGTCLRAPDATLQGWRDRLGFPEDFSPERFAAHYAEVEAVLQVAPSERRHLGRVVDLIAAGADAMGMAHAPLPRNAPGCDGQGQCLVGCPKGAKRSADIAWVPKALEAGAVLYTGLPVTHILRRGRRVLGVEARGKDRDGRPVRLRVRAGAVVLACGSLLSPALLAESGFRLPWLGRNLSLHPALGMVALCDQPMDPWNAVPQGYGVRGLEHEGVVFEGVYVPPTVLASALPMAGPELARWLDLHDHTAQFGFMIQDDGVGRVLRGLHGRPVATYPMTARHQRMIQRGAAVLAELLLRGGARTVLAGLGPHREVTTVEQARALQHARLSPGDFHLLGSHPLGTCRMGASAEEAVVDFEHRVFGTDNLFVVDGSAVPTSLGANPQLTIMAMARRAVEGVAGAVAG